LNNNITSELTFTNKTKHIIDENDGKSSDDFLRKLKELSTGSNTNYVPSSATYD
jgi:hypothetical protein